jgi:hypothetical protein
MKHDDYADAAARRVFASLERDKKKTERAERRREMGEFVHFGR